MEEVLRSERAAGRIPVDVSTMNYGWDIESLDPAIGERRFIEVKGRAAGADTVTVTCNEVMAALNEPGRWVLAVVEVEAGFARTPSYINGFPWREPVPGEASVVIRLAELLARAERMDVRLILYVRLIVFRWSRAVTLHIEDPEIDRLAQVLADRSGTRWPSSPCRAPGPTGARPGDWRLADPVVAAAVARARNRPRQPGLAGRLDAIAQECAALPVYDDRSPDEILGYDEHGAPS